MKTIPHRTHLEDHLDLVRSIVSKFEKNIADSDLFGIGCVALVEAHKSYAPEKGAFSTWATKLIKQSIFDTFRKKKKEKNLKFLEDSSVLIDEYKPIPLDVLSVLLKNEKNESKIDKENKKVLVEHFINNKSWAEIGRDLNLTRERVRQKGMDAIEKIRKKYRLILDEFEATYL